MNLDDFFQKLQHLQNTREAVVRPRHDANVFGSALEVRTDPAQYHWHGLKRGGDPEHPVCIFQYTLAGRGCYGEKNMTYHLDAQTAFTALVPSDHCYFLPPSSANWTFSWVLIRHPYIVERISKLNNSPIFKLTPNSMLVIRMFRLIQGIYDGTFHDPFAEEQALFDFLIEYGRVVQQMRYPQPERERLLQEVQAYVLQTINQPRAVEKIAEIYQMSRSNFSHYFKKITGLAPAHFISQVRLEEVLRRLLHTPMRLEEIARQTGFANANHLSKVFRRHFHLSPGEFRRQMRLDNQLPF